MLQGERALQTPRITPELQAWVQKALGVEDIPTLLRHQTILSNVTISIKRRLQESALSADTAKLHEVASAFLYQYATFLEDTRD